MELTDIWDNEQISNYLIRVLTFAAWISYNFLTASLICFLFAVSPTMKTKVLLSSIFFIADSVVRGNLMISYAFEVSPCLVRSGETFGFLANLSVLGLKKWTFVWTRVALRPLPFFKDAATFLAFCPTTFRWVATYSITVQDLRGHSQNS